VGCRIYQPGTGIVFGSGYHLLKADDLVEPGEEGGAVGDEEDGDSVFELGDDLHDLLFVVGVE
jgi:hypothetical protein